MNEEIYNKNIEELFHVVSKMHFKTVIQELEKIGLYKGQPPVLFMLYKKNGLPQNKIAEKIHVSKATLSKMLQRMEKNEFIKRIKDKNDKRITRVYITEKSIKLKPLIDEKFKNINNISFKNFSVEEKKLMKSLLLKIYFNLKNI
ncbi:DNA-binding MarR family transcriptional regulator [Hypnocyclicus thermotrophus]|uniref:DNA-binding MarR family transcriptional regulator n=1 Tax=Hypnocyclicus thermotrophus TaxID=1627895 RepID=A0AA46DZH9_9FUSO|nr:MarR family transcriptional regulator [Hypnocyclicus thermotrophus]TDT71452.1 DNA-binding MarR family transcriptional regulator [Hypnocyclicus thermotrophus]